MEKRFEESASFDAKKEIVLSLGVYELRGLARVLGVKSPTTKKREELISQILSLLESNQEISLGESNKRGRPFKSLSSVKNILDVISSTKEEEERSFRFSTFEEITEFNQEMPPFTLQSSDIFPSSGVLRKGKTFGYFVDSNFQRLVFIAPEYIQKYHLDTGDFLDCAVFEINNGDKCFVKKINKINGQNAEEYRAEIFGDYSQMLPVPKEIEGKIVSNGGRNVLLTDSPLYLNSKIKPILASFENAKRVFLGVNLCFEDKSFITNENNIFSFTSNYSGKIADGYDRVVDAINFVERMKELNEEVFLFIGDFANIVNCLDAYFEDDESPMVLGHKDKTVVVVKKLVSLAMAKNNNKNITSLILCNNIDIEDQLVKNELVKISNIIR